MAPENAAHVLHRYPGSQYAAVECLAKMQPEQAARIMDIAANKTFYLCAISDKPACLQHAGRIVSILDAANTQKTIICLSDIRGMNGMNYPSILSSDAMLPHSKLSSQRGGVLG